MSAARVVAIDGPAGSGKSTVARRVAAALGYLYVDTGALYRTVALLAMRRQIAFDDSRALGELASATQVRCTPGPEGTRVHVGDEEITEAIRAPEISLGASAVSAHPEVRAALLETQRQLARAPDAPGAVLEGRDIGSVVCPDADLKVFLTASTEERARRRHLELEGRGGSSSLAQVTQELTVRDRNDSTRAHAPLCRAEGAVVIDSTGRTVEQVIQSVVALAQDPSGGTSTPGA